MNCKLDNGNCRAALVYATAIAGAFLIVAGLVWAMRHYTTPAPLNAGRAAERAAALKELRASENQTLHTTAWLDPGKGIVRLRIEDAMELVRREWENPPAARSNLIAREEKANPPPPPPAPAKPSPFE